MSFASRRASAEELAEDERVFDSYERDVVARRWRLFGPVIAFIILLSELAAYVSPEFPHAWALSLSMMAVMAMMGALGWIRAPRAVLGWASVVAGLSAAAYIATPCAETGRFHSLHVLAMAVLMAVLPGLLALTLAQSVAVMAGSIAAWFWVCRHWALAPGESVDFGGLATSLTYLVFLAVVAVLSVVGMRRLRRRDFSARREIERLHRFAVEDVLYRHLPPSYVQRVLSGEARVDAPPDRRIVTVIFADLAGFTPMSEVLRVEELGPLMASFYDVTSEIAFRHGATVDKFIGDAVMAMLGAPESMGPGEQARRAIEVAREWHVAVPKLPTPHGQRLALRIGIHQDLVAVGSFGGKRRSDYTVLGQGVNIAARLEQRCRPGEILVSQNVRQWLEDTATPLRDLGPQPLKGLPHPVRCWVVDPRPNDERLAAPALASRAD